MCIRDRTKPQWIKSSLANKSKYQDKYSRSIKNNDEFWRKEGKRITWIKPYKKITKESSNELIIKTKPQWVKSSLATKSKYQDKYSKSIKSNDEFWRKEGKRITWIKPYKKIKDVKYSSKEVKIKWFHDGTLNASTNCIDRHLKD